MIYIYNPKDLQNPTILNGELEKFKLNPVVWYSEWTSDLIATDIKFNYPKLVEGELVEKSPEELKIEGIIPFVDGEYTDGVIIYKVEVPKGMLKPLWDSVNKVWIESATLEEKEEYLRKRIISKTSELVKIQTAGFGDNSLELDIQNLRELHKEVTHELALKEV